MAPRIEILGIRIFSPRYNCCRFVFGFRACAINSASLSLSSFSVMLNTLICGLVARAAVTSSMPDRPLRSKSSLSIGLPHVSKDANALQPLTPAVLIEAVFHLYLFDGPIVFD